MILEGMVTSLNAQGEPNIAPMGPIVDESMTWLHLRPFTSSTTYRNLKCHPQGVFHVVDDVLLLARAAISRLTELPPLQPAHRVQGVILSDACRAYEFEVESLDDSEERTSIKARVIHVEGLRDFFGFNRAKHAVLEAAILATRIHILPAHEIREQFDGLKIPVEKTAGEQELAAFSLLEEYVQSHTGS